MRSLMIFTAYQIWSMKAYRMRWAGLVACIRGKKNAGSWWGIPGVDGRIVLKWVLKNRVGGYGLCKLSSRWGQEDFCR
jgi:hypothetical protein